MIQLTEKQAEVGELFDWGNEMMRRSSLAEWTEKEIEAQMKLLNEQWEELRVHAMDKQTRLGSRMPSDFVLRLMSMSNVDCCIIDIGTLEVNG